MRCAVVIADSMIVDNIIVADASDQAPIGCFLVELIGDECDIGWLYSDGAFAPPAPVEPV